MEETESGKQEGARSINLTEELEALKKEADVAIADLRKLDSEIWKSVSVIKKIGKIAKSTLKELNRKKETDVKIEERIDKISLSFLDLHLKLYVGILERALDKAKGLVKELEERNKI